jgi:hypothetical protein
VVIFVGRRRLILIRSLVVSLMAILLAVSTAEARHWHFFGHFGSYGHFGRNLDDDEVRSDQPFQVRRASAREAGFGPVVARLIGDCAQASVGLKSLPLLQVSPLNADQRTALEQLRGTVGNASDRLAAACPRDVAPRVPAMLDALVEVADGLIAALDAIRPAAELLYNSLNEDQKARLGADRAADRDPAVALAAADRSRRKSRAALRANPNGEDNCAQWASSLREWPVRQVEGNISLSDPQHAALYDLAASMYRAADALVMACPREASLTPVAQIAAGRQRVDALRQAINSIRPSLGRFADLLSEEQRVRLDQVVNSSTAHSSRRREQE